MSITIRRTSMILNGKEFPISELIDNSLQSLLEYHHLHPDTVAIERNGGILDKSEFSKTQLNENDQIEIIKFVGGG